MSINSIRIILIDDHLLMREGLRMLIENDSAFEVVAEAENMTGALKIIAAELPDVILLDLDLGHESSLDRIRDILKISPRSRILILTGATDETEHLRALQNGARGIVLKNHAGAALLKAIKKVYQGEAWIDRNLTVRVLSEVNNSLNENKEENRKIASLTEREREIVKLIATGLVNKEIANRLFVGEKTIRNQLTIIYSKLEVANRLELAVYASHHELS